VNDQLVTTAAEDDLGILVGAVGAAGLFSLLIVIVWQVAATWRARMLAAREQQYQELAAKYAQLLEDTVELQRRTVEEQRQTLDELTQTRLAVGSMEKMMREIE
jgi:polysaccharide pyruvyl transferase WcaK-like protein